MNITSDYFISKKIETKHKWNQIHLLSMDYVLGANCRIPLIHMSKRKIILKKKMNVSMSFLLHICYSTFTHKNVFIEQVKACLSNTYL